MSTSGSVVVWEWLFNSAHWLPYEPDASNHIETAHCQWLARGGARAWPPSHSSVFLKQVSSSLAPFVVDVNTMTQTNQSTGAFLMLKRSARHKAESLYTAAVYVSCNL